MAKLVGIGSVDENNFLFGTDGNIVPEPGTAALLGMGLLGLALAGRRRSGA